MTQPASSTHNEYIGDGTTAAFAYTFKITANADLEVRLNGTLAVDDVNYDVTGVGVGTGGTVTFRVVPATDDVITFRLITIYEQLLTLTPNSALPAVSLEGQLDKIVRMIQSLGEQMSRVPQLAIGTTAHLRDRFLPTPAPLKLIGWDALGRNLSHYDPGIVQVTVGSTAHFIHGETSTNVPTVNAARTLTATGVFPAGCIRVGALVRVTTTFGNAGGLTTFSAGDGVMEDRWGAAIPRTLVELPLSSNNPGMYNAYELKPIVSAESVVLTADAGTFDTVGSATITGLYITLTAT